MIKGGSYLGRVSMRGRMLILISASMLPLGLFLAFTSVADYERTLSDARREVLQSASLAAARQSRIFATTETLLNTVRLSPRLSTTGGPACNELLQRLSKANPQFLSVMLVDADGTAVCDDNWQSERFSDPTIVAQVLRPDAPEFVVGRFFKGAVTRKAAIAAAMPLHGPDGAKTGALVATLNLDRLSSTADGVAVGGRRSIIMIQPASGTILTHFPSAGILPGSAFSNHPLIASMRSSPAGGVTEARGFDGVDRIFGFVPVEGAETSGLMLAVGESRNDLLAIVRQTTLWRALLGAGVFLLALLVVWWFGERLQSRPVERLIHIAARIGAGDFAVRTRLDPWLSPEMRALGKALDRMAVRLQAGRDAEQAVAERDAQYRLLAENTADLVTCVDENGVRTFASPSSYDLLGLRPEELVGIRPCDAIHPDDEPQVAAMVVTLRAGEPVKGVQYRMRHRDGHYIWVEVNGQATEDGQLVFAIRDVTQRRAMEEELAQANRRLAALASTDGLTGLLNRRSFDAILSEACSTARSSGAELSLMMIDVDRFKGFNDRYGHLAGDECLRRVGKELRSVLRRPGIAVARYGGEEFAVIMPGVPLSTALQEAEALRFAMLRLAMTNESSEYGVVTISIGVASHVAATDGDSADLMRRADSALYAAKAAGRNRTEIMLGQLAEAS